ncbi:Imm45 family immunity protein [Mesorhizobium sp. ASY16-5R]|uniref:Imm45 family immunity protein n=1 Tax=Mesorhizobium sp. ASY16-5R TaxID=3445772 RepID=UPI003FA14ABF
MLLNELRGFDISVGDVLRLPENYDLGPGSEPVDLLVFEPRDDHCGLGLMVLSGYKSGLTFCVFPRESTGTQNGLSADWLLDNWEQWFRFTYVDQAVPCEGASVIEWKNRRLVDDEAPDTPDAEIESAVDRMIWPSSSEVGALLSRPAGHFVDMRDIAPDLGIPRGRILVSWQDYRQDGYELMILYFDTQSRMSRTSSHTANWKAGSDRKPV